MLLSDKHNFFFSPHFIVEPEAAPQPAEAKAAPAAEPETPAPETTSEVNETTGTSGEQTTLVHNEDEAFALEPLDVSNIPGQFSRY